MLNFLRNDFTKFPVFVHIKHAIFIALVQSLCAGDVALAAVLVPEQPKKVAASKLCKKTKRTAVAGRTGASPPRKQQRLGFKPVNRAAKQSMGQNVPGSQVTKNRTVTSAGQASAASPSSSQLNSSFTYRLAI